MKLFETCFRKGFSYYERYFDTNLNKSVVHELNSKYEYCIPCSNGQYALITDQSLHVSMLEGDSRSAKDKIGATPPIYRAIRDGYWRTGAYNDKPRIVYLDIETRALGRPDPENAPEQVVLIQMLDTGSNQVIVLGLRPWEPADDYQFEYPVKYILCKDEINLLESFTAVFKAINPVIVYAWNGEGFDFPYLYNRMSRLGLDPNKLSCYDQAKLDPSFGMGNRQFYKLSSAGHYFLDAMEVYKRYVVIPRKSYSLDYIAEVEVRSNKVDHTEFPTFDSFYTGDAYNISEKPYTERIRESIRQGFIRQSKLTEGTSEYTENHNNLIRDIHFQFVYYGIMDVILLRKIDEKRNLSKIIVNIAKTMGVLYNDVLGTVKPWSQYISNIALSEHLVMPPAGTSEGDQYEGAFVRQPVKGKHKWVMNFDVNSMYPQYSIAGFGMSPETLVPKSKLPPELRELVLMHFTGKTDQEILDTPQEVWDKVTPILEKHNLSLTFNGTCYSKDKVGIIPRLVNQIYDGRKLDKKQMFKYEQQAVEIEKILSERNAK